MHSVFTPRTPKPTKNTPEEDKAVLAYRLKALEEKVDRILSLLEK
jgi:hypothetical protein